MFQRTLTKFGSDGGHVDLILEQDQYRLGDLVTGEIHVYGGGNACKVRTVDVFFMMQVQVQDKQKEKAIMVIPCESSFWVQSNERKVFPFTYQLPRDLLVSSESVSYFFMTELELADGNRYTDQDEVTIQAPEKVQLLLYAFQQLGFQEHTHSRQFNGYEQEFLLFPSILFRDQIREVRLTVALHDHGLQAVLILDLYEETEVLMETIWVDGILLEQMKFHYELEHHFFRWTVKKVMPKQQHIPPSIQPDDSSPSSTVEHSSLVKGLQTIQAAVLENPLEEKVAEKTFDQTLIEEKATEENVNQSHSSYQGASNPYLLYDSISLGEDEEEDEPAILPKVSQPVQTETSTPVPESTFTPVHNQKSPLEEVQKVVLQEGKRLAGAIGALAAELFNDAVDLLEEHRANRGKSVLDSATSIESNPRIITSIPKERIKKVDFFDEQNKGFSIMYMDDDD